MTVVKKTVAFHPIMDKFVRLLQSILIQEGFRPSYSAALNWMILYNVKDVQIRGMDSEVVKILQDFLKDEKTINELANEDLQQEYMDEIQKKIREKYIG